MVALVHLFSKDWKVSSHISDRLIMKAMLVQEIQAAYCSPRRGRWIAHTSPSHPLQPTYQQRASVCKCVKQGSLKKHTTLTWSCQPFHACAEAGGYSVGKLASVMSCWLCHYTGSVCKRRSLREASWRPLCRTDHAFITLGRLCGIK
jgi:hypothetical protein